MKFLCPNCKAKYQIADEKVAGRTLKMDCRRCGHSIVLRSDQAVEESSTGSGGSSASSRPAAPRPAPAASGRSGSGLLNPGATARRRGGSHVGPAPSRPAAAAPATRSALGADFRRSVSGSLAPEAPRTTPLDQWHVAINDVPVGPMRRDEIARKISTGAVNGESLAWREGFEDWRPLKDIPELAALLRRSEAARPPPKPSAPVPARPGGPPRPSGATASRPGATRPAAPAPAAAAARAVPPAAAQRNSNVVPIGGRLGASAAPALDERDEGFDDLEGEPTRVASSLDLAGDEAALPTKETPNPPPAQSAAAPANKAKSVPPPAVEPAPEALPDPFPRAPLVTPSAPPSTAMPIGRSSAESRRERRGLPAGAWIGIAGAMSFGVAMAVMIAPRLLPPGTPPPPAVETTVATTPEAPQPPREAAVEVPAEAPAAAQPAPAAEQPAAPAEAHSRTPRRPGTPATEPRPAASGAQAATKVPDPAFDRFADDGAGAAPIATRPQTTEARRGAGSGEGLNADQIRSVVAREQRGLQSCWEVAIRGMRNAPTVRMDVDVTIGASGTVTQANARGVGVGNLSECIERSVRRWRFPQSGDTSRTSFPVVFQGAS